MGGWAGIDVGGRRKGFHVAWVDPGLRLTLRRFNHQSPAEAASAATAWLSGVAPELVAIDSPREWARPGERSRRCEREFLKAGICGIRPTPSQADAEARSDEYCEWIENGLLLYGRLAGAGIATVECYPTAAWTQWLGPRRGTRAAWTRAGVERLRQETTLAGLDALRSQDQRDAFAAALTARLWDTGRHESCLRWDKLVVPEPVRNPAEVLV